MDKFDTDLETDTLNKSLAKMVTCFLTGMCCL